MDFVATYNSVLLQKNCLKLLVQLLMGFFSYRLATLSLLI